MDARGYAPWEARERLVDFNHCHRLCHRECGVHLQEILLRLEEDAGNRLENRLPDQAARRGPSTIGLPVAPAIPLSIPLKTMTWKGSRVYQYINPASPRGR